MFSISEVVGKLGSMPQIVSVYIPDESDIRTFYEEESRVSTISDMPMENEAMAVSKSRKHHLIVVFTEGLGNSPHHEVVMKDGDGNLVGWDVPPGLEYEVEGRDDLVWMSEDFVIDPSAMEGEIRVVLVAQRLTVIGEDDGVRDPVAMFPSPSTDMMIRERYGITLDSRCATAIVGFDEV